MTNKPSWQNELAYLRLSRKEQQSSDAAVINIYEGISSNRLRGTLMQDVLSRPATAYMHREFIILDENTNAAAAVREMNVHNVETVIVTRAGEPVGIVTDSDILDKVVMKGEDSDQVYLKSIMTSPVVTLSTRGTVAQAIQLMRINQVKRLPITDSAGVIGLVTQQALANAVRTSVIEKTLSKYRTVIREQYKPILGNIGILLQFSGVLLVVPAFLGTALGDGVSVIGMYLTVVGLAFSGFLFSHIGEKGPMNLKQASIFMIVGFIILSLFGSIPYIFINPFWPEIDGFSLFVNSFFESASGFTTTGLSVISKPENLPTSIDFYHSYTQWVGGLSFIYLIMILFFPENKLSAMKSVLGGGLLRVRELLLTIAVIFTVYTLILIFFIIFFSTTEPINAISLIFATVTSGGFIPDSGIITPEHPERLAILIPGMILAALPFAFHYHVFTRTGLRTRKILSLEVKVYLALIGAGILIFFALAAGQVDIYASAFHVISGSTTTGFQYLNLQSILVAPKAFLILLMMIGGAAFSTAGGIKIGRLIILYQESSNVKEKGITPTVGSASSSISSTANPYRSPDFIIRMREENKKRDLLEEIADRQKHTLKRIKILLSKKIVREILIVISLFFFISLVTGAVLSYLTNRSFEDALFESTSALTTTGLTIGITSMELDLSSKLLLTANMIVGRFEIITVLYIFFYSLRK
jgi:trk system potassium uptake protein